MRVSTGRCYNSIGLTLLTILAVRVCVKSGQYLGKAPRLVVMCMRFPTVGAAQSFVFPQWSSPQTRHTPATLSHASKAERLTPIIDISFFVSMPHVPPCTLHTSRVTESTPSENIILDRHYSMKVFAYLSIYEKQKQTRSRLGTPTPILPPPHVL